jgi:Domain of unknown function (DUF1707)
MSTDSAGRPRTRASDAEREEYARIVREAVGEGRLQLDEGDERLAKIYASVYRDELHPFVADLPGEEDMAWAGPQARDQHGREWRPGEWPRGGGRRREAWPNGPWAYRRMFGIWGLLRHGAFVAMLTLVLITVWALTGAHFFWPLIPLFFFGFGLFRHACWVGWAASRGVTERTARRT